MGKRRVKVPLTAEHLEAVLDALAARGGDADKPFTAAAYAAAAAAVRIARATDEARREHERGNRC